MAKASKKPGVVDAMLAHANANPAHRTGHCTVCALPVEFRNGIDALKAQDKTVPQIVAALKAVGGPAVSINRIRYHFTAGHHIKAGA